MAEDRNDQAPPERYPSVRQDDAVERTGRTQEVTGQPAGEGRTFDPSVDAPTPKGPETKPDGKASPAKTEGFLGPEGDPSEGKRR